MIHAGLKRLKYWWWLLPNGFFIWLVVLAMAFLILTIRRAWRIEYGLALVAAALAAVFQISTAVHARIRHFLECFSRCNESYARLNGRLPQHPRPNHASEEPAADEGPDDAIIDYFNLCAEEYLMHKMGVIPRGVWDVWVSGIHDCARHDHIKAAWDTEMKANCSYYGFDLGELMRKHHMLHARECSNRGTCPWDNGLSEMASSGEK